VLEEELPYFEEAYIEKYGRQVQMAQDRHHYRRKTPPYAFLPNFTTTRRCGPKQWQRILEPSAGYHRGSRNRWSYHP
jgi:hypothetical protein